MFKLHSEYKPTGDQPKAIDYLVKGIERGEKDASRSYGFTERPLQWQI